MNRDIAGPSIDGITTLLRALSKYLLIRLQISKILIKNHAFKKLAVNWLSSEKSMVWMHQVVLWVGYTTWFPLSLTSFVVVWDNENCSLA